MKGLAMNTPATAVAETSPNKSQSSWNVVKKVIKSPGGRIGGIITVIVVLGALFTPILAPHDPLSFQMSGPLEGMSAEHLLGTDQLGRDLLSRILHGSRISLLIGILSVAFAIVVGVTLGAVAGLSRKSVDYAIMRIMDAILAFPLLVLAIAISIALGRGPLGLVLAIGVVNLPVFTRLTRAQILELREREFVLAAVIMGAETWYIVRRHLIPHLLSTLIVHATTALSFAIVMEAGLSFLGMGIQAPNPSWGVMIADSKAYMTFAPRLIFAPAIALFITVLGLNLFGDALTDVLDPAARKEMDA